MPQPPGVEQILICHTPAHESVVLSIINVNAAMSSDDCSRLHVSGLVNVSLQKTRPI